MTSRLLEKIVDFGTYNISTRTIASESELETHNMSLSNISILDVYVQIELEESDKNKVE